MRPKRIILIRHGESEGNADPNVYAYIPDYKLDLTEQGLQQGDEAGRKLKQLVQDESVFFYVSPYARTRQTYKAISAHVAVNETGMNEEPRLREQDWGHFHTLEEGRAIDEAKDLYGPFYYRIEDGESGADVYDRISGFLETMHRDFNKPAFADNAVIVTHGMLLRLFLTRWLHWTVEEFHTLANPPNCFMAVLEREEDNKYALKSTLRRKRL